LNGLIQNFGGTLSALGRAMYSAGSLSENPLMFGFGLGLEVYGNLMKEGNKWTAQNPTTFFDPFFQFVDKLTITGEWIGQNLPTLFDINEAVNTLFNAALNWRPPRAPSSWTWTVTASKPRPLMRSTPSCLTTTPAAAAPPVAP
jgi:hypothetical protein